MPLPGMSATAPLSAWLAAQSRCLDVEREAQLEEATRRALTAPALHLRAAELSSGLFGRTVVTCTPPGGVPMPAHDIGVGDTVRLSGVTKASCGGGGGGGGDAHLAAGTADEDAEAVANGVVTVSDPRRLCVALDEGAAWVPDVFDRLRVHQLADDVTHSRLKSVVAQLEKEECGHCAPLLPLLFGEVDVWPHFDDRDVPPVHAPHLNEGQRAAVAAALAARDVILIHGPPGTGKTSTLVEYIRREVARGARVLACAPSNVAVDNLLTRLVATPGQGAASSAPSPLRAVRLGHPARIDATTLRYSLDAQVAAAEGSSIVADVRNELATAIRTTARTRDRAARRASRADERRLRKEVREREERVVTNILADAQVVAATTTGAASRVLLKAMDRMRARAQPGAPVSSSSSFHGFDVVVIDEVAQALEVSCFLPLRMGCKLVIAGDHCQLPPTIISSDAARDGLDRTLALRVVERFGTLPPAHRFPGARPVVHLLKMQYRMHEDIMQWSSNTFYDGALIAHDSVAKHRLSDLPGVTLPLDGVTRVPGAMLERMHARAVSDLAAAAADDEAGIQDAASKETAALLSALPLSGSTAALHSDISIDNACLDAPFTLIDTAGCDMPEFVEAGSDSKANLGEALLVVQHVCALSQAGVPPAGIAVVTPYNAQVSLLRALLAPLHPAIEVRSVDGFQGQEKEAIVLSLVRSNAAREVGFLADSRRLNVAVTRARRHVVIIGDSDTVRSDKILASLIDYAESKADVRSAAEFLVADDGSAIPLPAAPLGAVVAAAGGVHAGSTPSAGAGSSGTATRKATKASKAEREAARNKARASAPRSASTAASAPDSTPAAHAPADAHKPATGMTESEVAELRQRLVGSFHRLANVSHTHVDELHLPLPASHVDMTARRVAFAPDLTSLHRKCVHDAAEVCGLAHASEDVPGVGRTIAVSVPPPPAAASRGATSVPSAGCVRTMPSTPGHVPPHAVKSSGSGMVGLSSSGAALPPANALLAKLHAQRVARATEAAEAVAASAATSRTSAASSHGVEGSAAAAASGTKKGNAGGGDAHPAGRSAKGAAPDDKESDDDLALLDSLAAAKKRCGAAGCKAKVTIMGTTCTLCRTRYCYEHGLPEAHGCGDAASAAARAAFAAAHVSNVPSLKGWKRDAVSNTLHKALDAAAAARTAKGSGSSDKKTSGAGSKRK